MSKEAEVGAWWEKRQGGLMLQQEEEFHLDRQRLRARHQTRCKAFILAFIRSLNYRRLHNHHRYTGEYSVFVTLGGKYI